jgi:TldD protein
MSRSRRDFVKLATTAAAASVVWPGRVVLDARRPIRDAFGGERLAPPVEALAAAALDAARAAGASFADVRVDRQIRQSLGITNTSGDTISYEEIVGVGVRVIANGQWGFIGVGAPTVDTAADAGRRAVHQAQVNAKRRKTSVALAPAATVRDGRWATPARVDPFAVAIGEQQEALLAGTRSARAVSGVTLASASISFLRVDRLFASADGSHIEQTLSYAFPSSRVDASVGGVSAVVSEEAAGFEWQAAGYEVVPGAKLPDAMRVAADAALKESRDGLSAPARQSVDVGRYELVVSPEILYGLVRGTIVPALGMERALGKLTGDEGTSYAAPPDATLGALQIGHPRLTVRCDRSTPGGLMNAGWDDEGVQPNDFALVDQGVVVDYLATRENVSQLDKWYRSRRIPERGHGCAATRDWSPPAESLPNLTIAPGATSMTVEEMIKDVKRGIYLSGGGGANADFGLMNAYGSGSGAQEIRNGKLGVQLKDVAIQFQVQSFWKGLEAIGGASSVSTFPDGYSDLFGCRTVRSVPARFREVNVVNTGRTQ